MLSRSHLLLGSAAHESGHARATEADERLIAEFQVEGGRVHRAAQEPGGGVEWGWLIGTAHPAPEDVTAQNGAGGGT